MCVYGTNCLALFCIPRQETRAFLLVQYTEGRGLTGYTSILYPLHVLGCDIYQCGDMFLHTKHPWLL